MAKDKKGGFVTHEEDPLLTLAEAGRMVGKSPSAIKNWLRDGLLRATRDPTGLSRIRQSELERFYGATALADITQAKREREQRDLAAFREKQAKLAAEQAEREEPSVSGAQYNNG
jgi:hypothetical protein